MHVHMFCSAEFSPVQRLHDKAVPSESLLGAFLQPDAYHATLCTWIESASAILAEGMDTF